jgi:hypothetical protein
MPSNNVTLPPQPHLAGSTMPSVATDAPHERSWVPAYAAPRA